MKKLISYWPLLFATLLIASCQSQVDDPRSLEMNKFQDDQIVAIYEMIDKRQGDSLLAFLSLENELYRYEATLGFGSIQDSVALDKLSFLLNDESPKVRRAAAYSLGQLGDSSAITPIVQSLQEEDSVFVRRELLESLGKIITQNELRLLQYWPLKTPQDKAGVAWGLYRAGTRNVHDGVSLDIALSLLDSSNSFETRLGAAHFLYRSRELDLTDRQGLIIKSALFDNSPHVRMACALALRNAKVPASKKALVKIAKDADYRVRVNALRALQSFDDILEFVWPALNDSSHHVAVMAAGAVANKATKTDLEHIQQAIKDVSSLRVKSILYGTLLKLSEEKETVMAEIIAAYDSSNYDYYKAGLLNALGQSLTAQEFVVTKAFSETSKAITTAGISALARMGRSKDLPEELKVSFADIFKQAIETKDIAMIATAGSVITTPELDYKSIYDSATFLKNVRSELSLPKDIEAIQMLDRAIAFFDGLEYQAPENEYNHPIDWGLVKSLGKNPEAIISTDKGDISVKLLIEDSPGSVANFVSLSKQVYYNGKNFHRVVPNFVIQGGCNRGDGYGGEDYSIRSELANLRYGEGSLGMASAGKDTEGTQWFITHSPTPHLDGGYTIFGSVIDGMDVVHAMDVGDKILSIAIN